MLFDVGVGKAVGESNLARPDGGREDRRRQKDGHGPVEDITAVDPKGDQREDLQRDPRIHLALEEEVEDAELLADAEMWHAEHLENVPHRNLEPTLGPSQPLIPDLAGGGCRELATDQRWIGADNPFGFEQAHGGVDVLGQHRSAHPGQMERLGSPIAVGTVEDPELIAEVPSGMEFPYPCGENSREFSEQKLSGPRTGFGCKSQTHRL